MHVLFKGIFIRNQKEKKKYNLKYFIEFKKITYLKYFENKIRHVCSLKFSRERGPGNFVT